MIFIALAIGLPTVCDRHCNCREADRWAARFGRTVEHPNRRVGLTKPYSRPACSAPGCTHLVVEWGQGHEGHVDAPNPAA